MPETTEALPGNDEDMDDINDGSAAKSAKRGPGMFVVLMPAILIPLIVGAYFAFTQYTTLAEAAVAVGLPLDFSAQPEGEKPIVYGKFTTIENLLINPAQSNGNRFLVVSIGVETPSDNVIAELGEKDIVIRDAILRLLSRRTDEELSSIEIREDLKREILEELNGILQKGKIDRLYFTQFLLQ